MRTGSSTLPSQTPSLGRVRWPRHRHIPCRTGHLAGAGNDRRQWRVRAVIGQDMVNRLYDCEVVDPAGEKIGSVKRVWLDGQTGDPLWASVHTGLFGLKESFVPLQRAELADDQLRVPVDKEQVKESPKIEAANDHMSRS